jgi:phosphate transport system substrate-binding protein
MSKIFKIILAIGILCVCFFCNQKADQQETILKGSTTILVDETLKPIIEDQIAVFENDYEAKITIKPKSEAEVMQDLFDSKTNIAILTKKLSIKDSLYFVHKNIIPRMTPFATDAIALIGNSKTNDTLIALQDIIEFVKGERKSSIKGLVFDNPNSSTLRYIKELAGIITTPEKDIYSFKTNDEVIAYVAQNNGMIGVVGVNWLMQPSAATKELRSKINILSVKAVGNANYYFPSQNNIAENKYPLARDLYIINCQGFSGLGMGFASFLAGERGQRIILQSGLLPWKVPTRKIKTRKEINNDKN